MFQRKYSVSIVLLLVIFAGTVPVALLAFSQTAEHIPAPIDSAQTVTDWVEAHAATLPTARAGIIALPENYHANILDHMTAQQRADVWREKIDQALNSRTWTQEQQALITEFYQATTADIFLVPTEHPEELPGLKAWANDWAQRASQVIGVDDVRHIAMDLYDLPPEVAPIVSEAEAIPDYGTEVIDGIIGGNQSLTSQTSPRCTCNATGWFSCSVGQACLASTCANRPTGCGPWKIMPCFASCGYRNPVNPV